MRRILEGRADRDHDLFSFGWLLAGGGDATRRASARAGRRMRTEGRIGPSSSPGARGSPTPLTHQRQHQQAPGSPASKIQGLDGYISLMAYPFEPAMLSSPGAGPEGWRHDGFSQVATGV